MFQRITSGWQLAVESLQVLKKDKEMLLFPLLSGISCILVLASFAVPLWASAFWEAEGFQMEQLRTSPVVWGLTFIFYFLNYFVIVFFNTALVACAVVRLKGGDPTFAFGLRSALTRLPQIAAWALVSATVGIVLKAIESYSDKFGQIVASLIGMAWSITTYFVVPVLVVEQASPIQAVKRSVSVMRKTWGESLVANFSIGMIGFLLTLLAIIPVIAGIVMLGSEMIALGVILLTLGVLGILLISLISSALNSIILAALYIYAVEDTTPAGFDAGTIGRAFASK